MGVCVCEWERAGGCCVNLELSEQMGDGKGCSLRGTCWPLEEDESSTRLLLEGGSEIRAGKGGGGMFFYWMCFC